MLIDRVKNIGNPKLDRDRLKVGFKRCRVENPMSV